MRKILLRSFAFCTLLLLCVVTAFCNPLKRVHAKKLSAVKSAIKRIDAPGHHVPLLSDDAQSISRADSRPVLKICNPLRSVTVGSPMWSLGICVETDSSSIKYPLPFKTLFPEHEFS